MKRKKENNRKDKKNRLIHLLNVASRPRFSKLSKLIAKGRQTKHHNYRNRNTCMHRISFFHGQHVASGMDRVRPKTTNDDHLMKHGGHSPANTKSCSFLFWTSIDTCQRKVSADKHHISRDRFHPADQVLVFRLDRRLKSGQVIQSYCKQELRIYPSLRTGSRLLIARTTFKVTSCDWLNSAHLSTSAT